MVKNIKVLLGHFFKIFDTGRNQVIGRVQGMFSFALQIAIYLAVIGFVNDVRLLVVLTFLLGTITLFAGYVWIKTGLLDKENESKNLNNPQLMEVLHLVRKIEKDVEELKK